MRLRYHLILVLLAGFTVASFGAEPATKVRLEVWEDCLCGSPTHSRNYEQLKDERVKRMLFGTDVALTPGDAKLAPLALLQQHLPGNKLKDRIHFYFMGVVYRRSDDGHSYAVH